MQLKYAPSANFNLVYNYLGGPEKATDENDMKTVHELNSSIALNDKLSMGADFLVGKETSVTVGTSTVNALWYGGLLALKWTLNEKQYVSPRYEYFRDQHGYLLSSGPVTMQSAVLTYGHMLAKALELRAEGRVDFANKNAFTKGNGRAFVSKGDQSTLTVAMLFTY